MTAPHSVYRAANASSTSTFSDPIHFSGFTVLPIPILQDNYSYLLVCDATGSACVVDPADARTVHETIEHYRTVQPNLTLQSILTTHKHWDHAGGNNEFVALQQPQKLTVYGHSIDHVDGCTHDFSSTDSVETFKLGELSVNVLFTPCHTKGHVCYHIQSNMQQNNQCVFTGDTLFIAGCGKFFEGSADQMHRGLYEVLGKLDDNTAVFCGHEYTVSNLEFAEWADAENQAVKTKLKWAKSQRSSEHSIPLSTLGTTIGEEKQINPFLRCDQSSIQQKVAPWRKSSEVNLITTLAALRQAKDEQAHKKSNL